jgi:hypothetical protein
MPQASLEVVCTSFSGSLGDTITGSINGADVFYGNVKSITRLRSQRGNFYTISAYDKLIQASDYFLAADDPDSPYRPYNIAAEDLVEALLNMSELYGYISTSPGLTLATSGSVAIDRVYAWDMIKQIAEWVQYHVWCDTSGSIHFESLPPEPSGAASHTFTTGDSGELREIRRVFSEEELRNRVVVYGAAGLTGVASASSPHLPSGFYKTATFGHPLMDTQAAVDAAASVNLTRWNRATEFVECEIVGNENVQFGQTVVTTETTTGTSGSWFIYDINHSVSKVGFITTMKLTK